MSTKKSLSIIIATMGIAVMLPAFSATLPPVGFFEDESVTDSYNHINSYNKVDFDFKIDVKESKTDSHNTDISGININFEPAKEQNKMALQVIKGDGNAVYQALESSSLINNARLDITAGGKTDPRVPSQVALATPIGNINYQGDSAAAALPITQQGAIAGAGMGKLLGLGVGFAEAETGSQTTSPTSALSMTSTMGNVTASNTLTLSPTANAATLNNVQVMLNSNIAP